jgi:hypothetical protein
MKVLTLVFAILGKHEEEQCEVFMGHKFLAINSRREK